MFKISTHADDEFKMSAHGGRTTKRQRGQLGDRERREGTVNSNAAAAKRDEAIERERERRERKKKRERERESERGHDERI